VEVSGGVIWSLICRNRSTDHRANLAKNNMSVAQVQYVEAVQLILDPEAMNGRRCKCSTADLVFYGFPLSVNFCCVGAASETRAHEKKELATR
jgi:hypothetical protein